jgi:L-fucose dehydrogenase
VVESQVDLGLRDKVVIVTGGGFGIGAAISHALAAESAVPVIINNDGDAIQANLEVMRRAGQRFGFVPMWLDTPESCKSAVERVLAEFGRVDALVNHIGVNDHVGLEHGTPEKFLESVKRNMWHYYSMAHYCLPALKESRGTIVNTASKVGYTGQGETSGYAAAKGGVLALTREWAVELAPYGIRVNAIVPAEVWTAAYEAWLATFPDPVGRKAVITRNIPLESRMTTPAEIAATVVFLLSSRSSHTTGQHVFVDGGYVHLDRASTAHRTG